MTTPDREQSQKRSPDRRAAGRTYDQWFTLLDEWGAPGRPFREIAGWLETEHRLSNWWAQKLIVEYEQARGLRAAGARPDGTFTVGTSTTVAAPVERLYEAVLDPEQREHWLPGAGLYERTARPHRSARFDWADDGTRVGFTFEAKGDARSRLAVEHERLADPDSAQRTKKFWRERLSALTARLDGHAT